MPRTNMDRLIMYGLLGFAGYTIYGMAATGALGRGAQQTAKQLRDAWGDTPGKLVGVGGDPSGSSSLPTNNWQPVTNSGSRLLATQLRDLGGVPVAWDSTRQTLVQNVPGGNVYKAGDVFKNEMDMLFQLQSGGKMAPMDGGTVVPINAFLLAVA